MMKKCLVLDLDNTLWGGIVGEDGIRGLQLGFNPPGNFYLTFQQAILDLYYKGVILAINSKNNYEDAMEAIRKHPRMILRENHFAAMRINWNDKVENIKEIAKELNIGTDSIVFLDDDPFSRSIVGASLPKVEVPQLPRNPKDYTKFLLGLPYFLGDVITDEDKMRGNFYVTERIRAEAEKSALSRENFLKNLDLNVSISEDDENASIRLSQMTERTNQFNVLKREYTASEIKHLCADNKYAVFNISAKDRFGDYGIVGLAIVHKYTKQWLVESFLMSCRALGRGIEETFFHHIATCAKKQDSKILKVCFKKTKKNAPAEQFLEKVCGRRANGRYLCRPNRTTRRPAWVTISTV